MPSVVVMSIPKMELQTTASRIQLTCQLFQPAGAALNSIINEPPPKTATLDVLHLLQSLKFSIATLVSQPSAPSSRVSIQSSHFTIRSRPRIHLSAGKLTNHRLILLSLQPVHPVAVSATATPQLTSTRKPLAQQPTQLLPTTRTSIAAEVESGVASFAVSLTMLAFALLN